MNHSTIAGCQLALEIKMAEQEHHMKITPQAISCLFSSLDRPKLIVSRSKKLCLMYLLEPGLGMYVLMLSLFTPKKRKCQKII